MSTLWRQSITETIWSVIRLAFWVWIALDFILVAIFSCWFITQLLWHLRGWCSRVLFNSEW